MNPRIHHQPEGTDSEEIAAEALRDALQQCFEPVSDQSIPEDMLRILARAAVRQQVGEDA